MTLHKLKQIITILGLLTSLTAVGRTIEHDSCKLHLLISPGVEIAHYNSSVKKRLKDKGYKPYEISLVEFLNEGEVGDLVLENVNILWSSVLGKKDWKKLWRKRKPTFYRVDIDLTVSKVAEAKPHEWTVKGKSVKQKFTYEQLGSASSYQKSLGDMETDGAWNIVVDHLPDCWNND